MSDTDAAAALSKAIAALETQRGVLGDAITDAALAPLRAQLSAQQVAAPRRRQVSVLFLDIVGSTTLSRTLDPEEIHDIMDRALQAFSALVVQRGGKVLQYAGDSLLAAFGADAGHEDDAERAVRAGLDLLEEARVHAERARSAHGQDGFGVRVGVHTGQVLLGGGVDDEGTIRGYTVNIAARLEQAAPPGTLRISQETWHHVRGVFEVEAQPPLQVKGQDEPLRTYLVQRAKPRAFRVPTRGIDGAETPLVARGAELAQLLAAFESVARERSLHAVTLLAEAGLGKSRLIQELQHRLEAHAQICWLLLGRSQPSSTLQPYGLLRDILAWRLQIADSDSGEVARERLIEGLAPLFPADGELQAELLGQLIGMDFSASPRLQGVLKEPRTLRDRAFAAFTNYLRSLAASDGSPIVMLLDDLHWADEASLDWLQQLLKANDLPLMLVMAARPELLERRPTWGRGEGESDGEGGEGRTTTRLRLTLTALGAEHRRGLTAALLQRLPDAPASLHLLIDAQAEGNPFYAEELVKMLIDDGVIVVDGEVWQLLPARLRAAKIPGTLTGVLQARLDSLRPTERHTMQLASVVGPVFWDETLAALDPNAVSSLPALQRKAMVQRRADSAFAGTREETFQHHLLHQVTYDTVLKAERRDAHARTAAWLAERVGDREAEYLGVTAEHYERAGDHERALDWYERAATAASRRYANQATLTYLARMLAMPELGDLRRRRLILQRQTEAADLIADRVLQRQSLEERDRLDELIGDDVLRASTAMAHSLLADRLGERDRALAMAQRAAALAEANDCNGIAALAHAELSWLAGERGELALAHHHIELALPFATRAAQRMVAPGDDMYEIALRLVAASLHVNAFDYDRARELLLEARELSAPRPHQRRLLCSCHEGLARLALDALDESAAEHIEAAAAVALEIGQAVILAIMPLMRGRLALAAGDHERAVRLMEQACAMHEAIGSRLHQADTMQFLGRTLVEMNRPSEARAAFERALEGHAAIGAAADASADRLLIADTWCRDSEPARALGLVEAELPAIEALGALDPSAAGIAARAAVWRVLQTVGDARAPRQLEVAMIDLRRRTEKIRDPAARQRLLDGVPLHRELAAAWASAAHMPRNLSR